MLDDYAGDVWVLFRNGSKVWPVRIIDNSLDDGWLMFWVDHNIQIGLRLLFGTPHKLIFDVIIVDGDLKRVYHDWSPPNDYELSIQPLNSVSIVSFRW